MANKARLNNVICDFIGALRVYMDTEGTDDGLPNDDRERLLAGCGTMFTNYGNDSDFTWQHMNIVRSLDYVAGRNNAFPSDLELSADSRKYPAQALMLAAVKLRKELEQ